jgi:Zn-dependent M28 family amino/carboxypeptidase
VHAKRFDAPRAYKLLERQVDAGNRPAGSPTLRRLARQLRRKLPGGRFEPVTGHPGLRNIVGTLPGPGPALVIAAHYDSEARPRNFVGANDSAAGTAAVIELSRTLKATLPAGHREVRFVLFDGEEEAPGCNNFIACGLRGSKAYAAAHSGEIGELILLDYIAGKKLRIPREQNSNAALWTQLRSAARAVGAGGVFPGGTQGPILDDHIPFTQRGVPAIDLIDFSYEYADTAQDTPDKLSVSALNAVGETVAQLALALATSSRS